ncbi:hypothetical protein BDV93DRAFT_606015 [Ceratobasidium sp. AG-I]|nr:hypothetical protein BDV93DRAFT_606015 [Ceratobasidium sp. AG-I]
MLTCKSTFTTAASHVWANLDGVKDLTDLLVETPCPELPSSSQTDTSPEVIVDFTRFDIYAPLVRHLRVYGRTARYLQGEHRRRCALRSQQSALFPRLESITMHTSDLCHDSDALMWIEILATPSLAELRIVPIEKRDATAFLSYLATSSIANTIAKRCPGIKRIEFYPINIPDYDGDKSSDVLWKDPLRQSFGSLVHLREVTSSILFINNGGLATLGALPELQRLSIDGSKKQLQEFELSAPESSFPALRHLSIIEVDKNSIFALLTVRPLLRQLTSLLVRQCFESANESYDVGQYCHLWLADTLPLILQHIPTLKRLSYDAGQSVQNEEQGIDLTSLLQAMSELRLEYLSISNLYFMDDFIKGIPPSCPSLVELRIPAHEVLTEDLHWFAEMPNLKRLAVRFAINAIPDEQYSFQGPLEVLESTERHIHEEADCDWIEQAAKFQLSLWPNLRYIARPSQGYCKAQDWRDPLMEHFRFIDGVNKVLRAPRLPELDKNVS